MKVKPMSLRSPEEIRREVAGEWNWNIAAMAANYHRSLSEMAVLIQHGGETYRENRKKKTTGPALVRASYDVIFSQANYPSSSTASSRLVKILNRTASSFLSGFP